MAHEKATRAAVFSIAIALSLFAVLSTSSAVDAAAGTTPAIETLMIANVTLIDGNGGEPRNSTDVLVRDGKISAVGSGLKSPEGARILDGTGKFLMPGLIDSHVHMHYTSSAQWTKEQNQKILDNNPRAFLYNGVTSVVNVSSPFDWIMAQRKAQRQGTLLGPRIFVAPGFTPPGGWGSDASGRTVSSPTEARQYATAMADAGVDGFKVFLENGLDHSKKFPLLQPATLDAIVMVARERHLPVLVHAMNIEDYRLAAAARPTAIMHGIIDSVPAQDPIYNELSRNKTIVVPTLTLLKAFLAPDPRTDKSLTDPILESSEPDFMLAAMRDPAFMAREREIFIRFARMDAYQWAAKSITPYCENTRRMHSAGVRIALGTDAGGPYGYTFPGYNTPWELQSLTECGLTPMQAIVAGTRNGAAVVQADNWLGTIGVGKVADMLLLSQSPVADIRNIRSVEVVILNGVPVQRATLSYNAH